MFLPPDLHPSPHLPLFLPVQSTREVEGIEIIFFLFLLIETKQSLRIFDFVCNQSRMLSLKCLWQIPELSVLVAQAQTAFDHHHHYFSDAQVKAEKHCLQFSQQETSSAAGTENTQMYSKWRSKVQPKFLREENGREVRKDSQMGRVETGLSG